MSSFVAKLFVTLRSMKDSALQNARYDACVCVRVCGSAFNRGSHLCLHAEYAGMRGRAP